MTEHDVYDMAAQERPDGDGGNGPYRGETASPARDSQQDQGSATPDRAITFAELKTAAYNGEFPYEGLAMPDRIMFWAMRDMYQQTRCCSMRSSKGFPTLLHYQHKQLYVLHYLEQILNHCIVNHSLKLLQSV